MLVSCVSPTGMVGPFVASAAYKEVGGLATAFAIDKIHRPQSGGAFDDKFKLLSSTWSSSCVA